MPETFTVGQRVYYVDIGPSDAGTVTEICGPREGMLPLYLVTWDNGDSPDRYTAAQLAPVRYTVIINTPGYLSEQDDVPVFETTEEAWQYLVSEVERAWDSYENDPQGACVDAHTQMHNLDQSKPGTVYAGTPGYGGDHDLGVAYSVVETAEPLPAD
jgi:hypothetical protein